jgi:hypothetical protein
LISLVFLMNSYLASLLCCNLASVSFMTTGSGKIKSGSISCDADYILNSH